MRSKGKLPDVGSVLRNFVFKDKGTKTKEQFFSADPDKKIPVFINEFWTAKQRQASSLHEVSYRACFKPQLPRFFIERFTQPGDTVLDPFSGRGTTVLEASLLGRKIVANDVNPLSQILCAPRLSPPTLEEIKLRLEDITVDNTARADIDLSMFFERKTLAEILSIRKFLQQRKKAKQYDHVDAWIQMVSTNRLTGHSPGFFSVFTLPPNQAASAKRQLKINADRNQKPSYRDTKALILRKSKQLIKGIDQAELINMRKAQVSSKFLTGDASKLTKVKDGEVTLTVTSPPFLDVVQYAADNWLRCWFNEIDAKQIEAGITMSKTVAEWNQKMTSVFYELFRVTKKGGYVAFEVGEVRGGKVKLEEEVVNIGTHVGFVCEAIMLNTQVFTKTSNIWKVSNNTKGTNTNRIVIFRKP